MAMEAATKDVRELQGNKAQIVHKLWVRVAPKETSAKPKSKKKYTNEKPTKKLKPCFRCNRINHTPDNWKFKTAKCHECGKIVHIVPACRPKVNHLDVHEDDTCVAELYSFQENDTRTGIPVKPLVNGKGINMELDTGSGVSVMSKAEAMELWGKQDVK